MVSGACRHCGQPLGLDVALFKDSRWNLLSVLIVSLALADLCFSCHFLLPEMMMTGTLFDSRSRKKPFTFTCMHENLCLSVIFLTSISTNAIMLKAVAIALYGLLSLHSGSLWKQTDSRFRSVVMVGLFRFRLCGYKKKYYWYKYKSHPGMDQNRYSLVVVYGCVASDASFGS